VLYVADTLNNRIRAISNPLFRTSSDGIGKTVASGGALNQPLGLTVAPNGHILTVNGGDGYIIEFSPNGRQLAKELIDDTGGPPPGAGTLFGLIYVPDWGIYFVDDGSNTLNLLH
jgi:sugar lactone lactonase YvrE